MPFTPDPAEAETRPHQRRTAAIRLSPETAAHLTLGSIVSGAVALVVGTVFVWTIKSNSEQSLQQIKDLRGELTPIIEQHRRLWYEHEARATCQAGGTYPRVGP